MEFGSLELILKMLAPVEVQCTASQATGFKSLSGSFPSPPIDSIDISELRAVSP